MIRSSVPLLEVPQPSAQPVDEDVPAIFRQPTVEEERITMMTFHKITENTGEGELFYDVFCIWEPFCMDFGWLDDFVVIHDSTDRFQRFLPGPRGFGTGRSTSPSLSCGKRLTTKNG